MGILSVGCEDAIGQAHDSVQVEAREQLPFDLRSDAVAEEEAVGQHDATASAGTFEHRHHVLEEQQRRLTGAHSFGEVVEDTALLFATEGRIGGDDIHAVGLAYLANVGGEGVALNDVGSFDAVQQAGS